METMPEKVRHLSALFLALALVVGGVTHGVHASDMAVKMATAPASEMPMPSGCNGCSDDNHGMPLACFAFCGGVVAVLPVVPTVAAAVSVCPPAASALSIAGHHGPPDPYPPRPTILG